MLEGQDLLQKDPLPEVTRFYEKFVNLFKRYNFPNRIFNADESGFLSVENPLPVRSKKIGANLDRG